MFDTVFLAGSAWGSVYYIGVYKGLLKKYGSEQVKKIRFGGNSAGALLALFMAVECSPREIFKMYLHLINSVKKRGNWGMWSDYHEEALDAVLSSQGETKLLSLLNKRFFVGVTTFPYEHQIIENFNSLEHVRRCVHASMMIPWFCYKGLRSPFENGTLCLDGSFSKLAPRITPNTLTVGVYPDASFDLFPLGSYSMYVPPDKKEALIRIQEAQNQILNTDIHKTGIPEPERSFFHKVLVFVFWGLFLLQKIFNYIKHKK
jgi:hypothetical protein